MKRAAARRRHRPAPAPKAPREADPYWRLATLAVLHWGAIQKPEELSSLCRLVHRLQADTVLEVGTALGGTFYCWIQIASPDALLLSVDLPHGSYSARHGDPETTPERLRAAAKPGQRTHFIRCDSHDSNTLEQTKAELGGREVDFLFIDGDHTYEGVRSDFEMYAPLVRDGGVVAFHDVVMHLPSALCEVRQLWQELKPVYKEHWEFIDRSYEPDICGIGAIRIHR